MTELQMLKHAARAGGLAIDWNKKKGEYYSIMHTPHFWNPGLCTKQAFELADHLRLMVDMDDTRVRVVLGPLTRVVALKYNGKDRMAANRLAIVMLAAQVGESMS
jgi:hypothetical protein